MTFGRRAAPPTLPGPEDDNCPICRGSGAIRGRGQRKVCITCKGSGKKAPVESAPAAASEAAATDAAMLPPAACEAVATEAAAQAPAAAVSDS